MEFYIRLFDFFLNNISIFVICIDIVYEISENVFYLIYYSTIFFMESYVIII